MRWQAMTSRAAETYLQRDEQVCDGLLGIDNARLALKLGQALRESPALPEIRVGCLCTSQTSEWSSHPSRRWCSTHVPMPAQSCAVGTRTPCGANPFCQGRHPDRDECWGEEHTMRRETHHPGRPTQRNMYAHLACSLDATSMVGRAGAPTRKLNLAIRMEQTGTIR